MQRFFELGNLIKIQRRTNNTSIFSDIANAPTNPSNYLKSPIISTVLGTKEVYQRYYFFFPYIHKDYVNLAISL